MFGASLADGLLVAVDCRWTPAWSVPQCYQIFWREWQLLLRFSAPDKYRAEGTKHKALPKRGRPTVGLTVVFAVHNRPVVCSIIHRS